MIYIFNSFMFGMCCIDSLGEHLTQTEHSSVTDTFEKGLCVPSVDSNIQMPGCVCLGFENEPILNDTF